LLHKSVFELVTEEHELDPWEQLPRLPHAEFQESGRKQMILTRTPASYRLEERNKVVLEKYT